MTDFTEMNSTHASFSCGVSVKEKEHMGSGVIETVFEPWFTIWLDLGSQKILTIPESVSPMGDDNSFYLTGLLYENY